MNSILNRRTHSLSLMVVLCLAATWLVWGSTYLAIKFALVSFPPFFQMGSRFLLAGLVLLAWMALRGAALPNLIQWRNALIVAVFMLCGGMGATAYSEQTVASGLIVAFIAVQPMVQACLLMFWKQYPSKLEWVGILIGLAGVIGLVQGQGFAASPIGLVVICIGIVMWAIGSVLSQRVTPLAPGAVGFASEMILGGLMLLLMSWLSSETPVWPPTTQAALAWLYLVVFGSLIAFNAYMYLLANASSALATSYSFVNPLIALMLGVSLGGEIVSTWEWACAGVVIVGVVLIVTAAVQRGKS
jgi:drug/metabolite transporter (DMT)-like permease